MSYGRRATTGRRQKASPVFRQSSGHHADSGPGRRSRQPLARLWAPAEDAVNRRNGGPPPGAGRRRHQPSGRRAASGRGEKASPTVRSCRLWAQAEGVASCRAAFGQWQKPAIGPPSGDGRTNCQPSGREVVSGRQPKAPSGRQAAAWRRPMEPPVVGQAGRLRATAEDAASLLADGPLLVPAEGTVSSLAGESPPCTGRRRRQPTGRRIASGR